MRDIYSLNFQAATLDCVFKSCPAQVSLAARNFPLNSTPICPPPTTTTKSYPLSLFHSRYTGSEQDQGNYLCSPCYLPGVEMLSRPWESLSLPSLVGQARELKSCFCSTAFVLPRAAVASPSNLRLNQGIREQQGASWYLQGVRANVRKHILQREGWHRKWDNKNVRSPLVCTGNNPVTQRSGPKAPQHYIIEKERIWEVFSNNYRDFCPLYRIKDVGMPFWRVKLGHG